MKKLMIAAAIVCAATVSQAVAFNWSSSTSSNFGLIYKGDGSGTTAKSAYTAMTFYMFDAATYSQQKALTDFSNGVLDTSKKVAETSLSAQSKLTAKSFDYGEVESYYDFFFVGTAGDQIFISSLQEHKQNPTSGTTPLTYADLGTTSKGKALETTTFGSAGWYKTVPEPTSGLLLLLGVAGLALRRRRA